MASLTSTVQKLEQEISSLKSAQYLETQKVRLMVSSLGEEVVREGKAREEAVGRAARLQEELEEERRISKATVQELESQAERAKRERSRALEERQRQQEESEPDASELAMLGIDPDDLSGFGGKP